MLVNIAHAAMYLYLKKVLGAGEEGRCSHSMEMGNREGPPLNCIHTDNKRFKNVLLYSIDEYKSFIYTINAGTYERIVQTYQPQI